MSEHLKFKLRKLYEKRGLRVGINLTQRSGIYSDGLRSRALILKYMVWGGGGVRHREVPCESVSVPFSSFIEVDVSEVGILNLKAAAGTIW